PPPSRSSPLSLHDALPILLKRLPILNRPYALVPPRLPPYFGTLDRERRARMIEECARPGSELQRRIQQIWLPLFTPPPPPTYIPDRKSTRLNSSHVAISYA